MPELQCIHIVSLDEQMLSILEDTWIAADDALIRDKAAGREGQGRSEGGEKQIGSDIRRPGDHLGSMGDAPVKICTNSVFYSDQPPADQPSEYRTANSTFFRPPGKSADQSPDGKDGALHSGSSNHPDMARKTSKPARLKGDSDGETDELPATDDFSEPSASEALYYDSRYNRKGSSPAHAPAGVEYDCPVCLENLAGETKAIPICGHKVCGECWKGLQTCNPVCPVCRKVYGTLRGNQPKNARMTSKVDRFIHLPGYEPFSTIVIDYSVPDGIQTVKYLFILFI